VIVGGGLGRTPIRGQVVREILPWQHILLLRSHPARLQPLRPPRQRLQGAHQDPRPGAGHRGIRQTQVDAEWAQLKDGPATITQGELERVAAHFGAPAYDDLPAIDLGFEQHRHNEKAFARWVERNTHAHKVPGYAAVTLSLKPHGVAPGDITSEQMELVADLADRYSFGELRISHEQNIILADVRKSDLHAVWQKARANGLATPNIGLLTGIICCPGGDFCDLANAKSIPIATAIQARFDDLDYLFDIGDIDLNISGCMNACGHHHVGHIGVLGVDKNDAEFYQVTLGGRQGNDAKLGKVIGPSFGRGNARCRRERSSRSTLRTPPRRRALPRHLRPHRHRSLQEPRLRRPRPRQGQIHQKEAA
jgi:sulfite reductase (NADPH) hemoprotein beta-component